MPVAVFASFRPRPDAVDDAREVLEGMVGPTRGEPGCQRYDLYRSEDADGAATFHLFEVYAGTDALEAHRGTEHYRAYRAVITDHLAGPIGVAVLDEVDVATA